VRCKTACERAAMLNRDRSRHGVAPCSRELLALGHEVKQVPPAYAKPFRQGHKNDFRDAHAIAEAVQRPSTRCVASMTGTSPRASVSDTRVWQLAVAQRRSILRSDTNRMRAFLGYRSNRRSPARHRCRRRACLLGQVVRFPQALRPRPRPQWSDAINRMRRAQAASPSAERSCGRWPSWSHGRLRCRHHAWREGQVTLKAATKNARIKLKHLYPAI
jgi:hypothetical protein